MYTLYFPFHIIPGYQLDIEKNIVAQHGNLTIIISQIPPYITIEVTGFNNESEARHFINHLWLALRWAMVEQKTPLTAMLEPKSVTYSDDPNQVAKNLSKLLGGNTITGPVHGLADGDAPFIYPTGLVVKKMFTGDVSVIPITKSEKFLNSLLKGLELIPAPPFILDDQLETALDLYSSSFTESTQRAKLLTLVTCLECIAKGIPKHKVAQDLMKEWKKELLLEKQEYDSNSVEYDALDALERELFFRRESSLRSRVWNLVCSTLKSSRGENEAKRLANRARKIYDERSTLTHEGRLPVEQLNKAVQDVTEIVSEVLKAKILENQQV